MVATIACLICFAVVRGVRVVIIVSVLGVAAEIKIGCHLIISSIIVITRAIVIAV